MSAPSGLSKFLDLPQRGLSLKPRLRDLFPGAVALLLVSAVALAAGSRLAETDRMLVYLLAVGCAAWVGGLVSGLIAAVLAVGVQNFLFAEPHYALLVSDPGDLLTLGVFLAVAAAIGALIGLLRRERDQALDQATVLQLLRENAESLQRPLTSAAIMAQTAHSLTRITREPVLVFGPRHGEPDLLLAIPDDLAPSAADLQAAAQCLIYRTPEPATASGWSGSAFTFLPVAGPDANTYALAYHRLPDAHPARAPRTAAALVLAEQAKLALERLDFAARASEEKLRAALLASLSHDLRTPLASILGAATTLKEFSDRLPAATQAELIGAIESETRRLSSYVSNLLQMTRLQAGIRVDTVWVDPSEVIGGAISRAEQTHPHARIIRRNGDLPMIHAEAALLEQALYNLLDNALRYTKSAVTVTAKITAGRLDIGIHDQGPGLDALGTTGLGLRITKAIAEALGGDLRLSDHASGGLDAVLSLPAAPEKDTADVGQNGTANGNTVGS